MDATRYETTAAPPEMPIHRTPRNEHLADQVRRLAYPAGGIVSTVPDLLLLGRSLLQGGTGDDGSQAIPHEAARLLWDLDPSGLPVSEDGQRFHLGWRVGGPGGRRSDRTLWHPGASGTALWMDPDRECAVALLTADWYLEDDVFGAVIDAALEDADETRANDGGTT
jgi:CubicO group peptidase (beta-lactamase class C family)